jgi:hypothetical protein
MNYKYDPIGARRRTNIFQHAGFQYGFIGGVVMWGIRLVLLLLFGGTNHGDILALIFQIFVYIFIGKAAAQKHYVLQRNEVNATRGVKGAGTGAALITSVLSWLFIIVRSVVRDAFGYVVLVDPVGLFCLMVVDVLIAMGIGSWAGKSVEKKYQIHIVQF